MSREDFEPVSGRLFVAIELPAHVTAPIQRLQREEGAIKKISWIPPEKIHLTLAFMGELDPFCQEKLFRDLPDAKVEPFILALEGLGVFPKKTRPQVLWAGLAPVDPRLFQLHGKVERILMDLGFEPERRRYNPHVTIARCQAGAAPAVAAILKKQADFGTAPFPVSKFALFSSELGPRGSVYRKWMEVEFEK